MVSPHEGSRWERLIVPGALLLGVVVSFLGCCAAGAYLAHRNVYAAVERFHPMINPESLHYPGPGQVAALARSQLRLDRVAVVVGGSSITHGVGQRLEEVWTRKLQAELGDGYRVINLAMRAAYPSEFAGHVVETLSKDYPKLIYVTITGQGRGGPPDGDRYQYFYWEAEYRGMLLPHPERQARLRALEDERDKDDKFDELQRRAGLHRRLLFTHLWSALAL